MPDPGLTYTVHLDWCCSPTPQVFMTWGCLRTCESIALEAGDYQTADEVIRRGGVSSEGIIPAATPTAHHSISELGLALTHVEDGG